MKDIAAILATLLCAGLLAAPGGAQAKTGTTIEAEALAVRLSANYEIAETGSGQRYVGYFDEGSFLCYEGIDLTGVRSIELHYARDSAEPGRYAVVATEPDGRRINLGERDVIATGGWETYAPQRIGLARALEGVRTLCLYGVTGGGIFNLDRFVLSDRPAQHDGLTVHFETDAPPALSAAGHDFTLERVTASPLELWAMAFLPDGRLVATQKNGELLVAGKDRRLQRAEGTPAVWNRGQGGLLDVQPHPDYAANGWLYLTFSDPAEDGTTMTRVVRGKLDGLRWTQQEDVYTAPRHTYSESYAHFGSRLAFVGEYLYLSIGERNEREYAQDLAWPHGKIHRLHHDGSVPTDNPYTKVDGALPSIWSYGHRNPQGLTVRPDDGSVWSAEHGPMGGDEVNIVRRGANYGWPLVSFGINYDGTPVSESPYRDGVEPPVHHWTPSIGVSQLAFYEGAAFAGWRGHLLAASLGGQQLRLLRIEGENVVADELLFEGLGRIRDIVTNGADGSPYVLLNNPDGGVVYRLAPAGAASSPSSSSALSRAPSSRASLVFGSGHSMATISSKPSSAAAAEASAGR